jgi:hypothetical protein
MIGPNTKQNPSSHGFTMAEVLTVIAVIVVVVAVSVKAITGLAPNVATSKLNSEVIKLNQIVSVYLAEGGSMTGVSTVQDAIDKLKTIRSASDTQRSTTVMSGRAIDVRTVAKPLTAAEASTTKTRVIWDAASNSFKLTTSGAGGAGEFYLDDALATTYYGIDNRAQTALRFNSANGWAWQDTNATGTPTPYNMPLDNGTTSRSDSLFDPNSAPPMSQLPTPVISPNGGSFTGDAFPTSVTISPNGSPDTGSSLQYMVTHSNGVATQWATYTSAVNITYGDTVSAKNVSTVPTRYMDSTADVENYTSIVTTLPTPIIVTTGGSFPKASFPTTIGISQNGAPGGSFSTLQYRVTSASGTVGAWINYNAAATIAYGDTLEARNLSTDAGAYLTSGNASQTYTLLLTPLPTPANSPAGGTFTGAAFPSTISISSNSAPSAGSILQYRKTTGGTAGAWTVYTTPVAIVYGDAIESKNVSTDNTLYSDSAVDTDVYSINQTTLPTPVITPSGGSFPKASFPSTFTVNANGAPGGTLSVLQYRVKPSGGSYGAWTNYTAAVSIAYGDQVQAKNTSLNATAYNTSNSTSQTYTLQVTTLPTPINTPVGGTFSGATFPSSVTISSNNAPATGSQLQYRKTTGGVTGAWTNYTTAIPITFGDKIESQNLATDTTLYATSGIDTDTYAITISNLPAPVITPTGGGFPKASFPATATISANGAPAGFYTLQYRKTSSSGTVGAWTTYSSAIPIAYGDKIEAQNISTNTAAYNNSTITAETYTLTVTILPTPTITPTGGGYPKASFPASVTIGANGAPGGVSSALKYRRTTGGVTGAWTTYSTAVPITYGDTIEAQNIALDVTLYANSAINTQTYTLTTTALPIPIITPPGGSFLKAAFPPSVTISPNGAPASSYTLKYRRTTGGVTGAWTNYTSAVAITYGDTVEAQNVSNDTTLWSSSGIASETYILQLTTLPTPINTPAGGSFYGASFPSSVTVSSNGATGTGWTLQYRRTTGGTTGAWTTYTAAIPILYGDTIESRNLSTDSTLWVTSGSDTDTYLLTTSTLPTPIISPAGGSFAKASFPSSATISSNGAPSSSYSVLQYRLTDAAGTVGAWTNYTAAVPLGYNNKLEARNLTQNTTAYSTSGTATQTYNLSVTTLPTPVISPNGGSFSGATFPATATISSNGAPGTGSQLQYMVTHSNGTSTAWTAYSTAIALAYGDTVSAKNYASDTTLYADSLTTAQTYTLNVATLPTPVITPVGGAFPKASFPSTATINANGAAAGYYTLQYRITNAAGTVGSWTTYSTAVALNYGDKLEARNLTANASLYNTSLTNSQTYTLSLIQLTTPVITPAGGTFTDATFPSSATISSNGAPGAGSQLQYQITSASGSSTSWAVYSSAVSLTYGDTLSARNISTDTTLYSTSATTSQTYATQLTTLPTPLITPSGGTFTVSTLPSSVTISANSAPAGKYTLQYQIIHLNGSSTAWANYTTPVSIVYGDTVSAKNVTAHALYATSAVANQTYSVTPISLPVPTFTTPGGSYSQNVFPSVALVSANGAPGGTLSVLQYQVTHSGGSTGAWTTYGSGVPIVNGDTVTVRNLTQDPALYTTSGTASATYLLINNFAGTIVPTWTNVGGGPGLLYVIDNSNANNITLSHGNTKQDLGGGQIIDAGIQNVLTFSRTSFNNIVANSDFPLGTLVILNGTTFNDSEATSATLHLAFSLTQPVVTTAATDVNFTMTSTANSGDRQASADYVTIQNPTTSLTVSANGITYKLQISVTSVDASNGWVSGNTFYVYEGASATATLKGRWVPQ